MAASPTEPWAGPLVVMGASAGGVDALATVVGGLPVGLPAPILVVLHVSATATSALPEILTRTGGPPAHHARDGETLRPGRVYVAPPDRHLVVAGAAVRLDPGPTINMSRPAVDRLFTSAAAARGPGVIGVVLSGTLDDGTAGLMAIGRHGGTTVVQDPDDAVFPGMPASAVRHAGPDHVVPLAEVAGLVASLVTAATRTAAPAPAGDGAAALDGSADAGPDGGPSGLTCPACGGALWERPVGDLLAFRCRVGHAYSADSLATAQVEELEVALWTAVTALEERADLAARMARRFTEADLHRRAERWHADAVDATRRSNQVRQALYRLAEPRPDEPSDGRDDQEAR